jgi:hypothetical protein
MSTIRDMQSEFNFALPKPKAGERGGGDTRGPECSEGPGNLDKIFVSFTIAFMFVLNEIHITPTCTLSADRHDRS